MTPHEFIIKKFELNNPDLIKIIDDWSNWSVYNNWDNIQIAFGDFNISNSRAGADKCEYFTEFLLPKVSSYLLANGFRSTTHKMIFPDRPIIAPDGKKIHDGWLIVAE